MYDKTQHLRYLYAMARKAPTAQVDVIPTPTDDAATQSEPSNQPETPQPTPAAEPTWAEKLYALATAPPSPSAVSQAIDTALTACQNAAANALTGCDVMVDRRCITQVADALTSYPHCFNVVRGGTKLSIAWGKE